MTALGEVITAAVTPFSDDLAVDFSGFASLCSDLIASGSDGLVVAGTTGEAPTLEDDEKLELFRVAREVVPNGSILAGTGTASTAHSVALTKRANETGVDGFLVVVPYYNRPPARGIVEHFRAIGAATDLPLMIYNIPKRTAIALERATIAALADIPNVAAIKQADPDLELARFIVEETPLALYAGNDDLVIPFTELGGVGGVFVYSHLVGASVKKIIGLVKAGDRSAAESVFAEIAPALDAVEAAPNPTALKAALKLLGRGNGRVRLPLSEPEPELVQVIASHLERAGFQTAALA